MSTLVAAHALADGLLRALALAGLPLLAAIWLSTALVQVPCHRRLAAGFEPRTARRLVRTHWIRTVAWSARAALATSMPFAQ